MLCNVNVNCWFLLEPSQKSHAIELSYFCGALPDDATESVATHSSRLQPSIICMPQLQLWCSAALVPKFTTLKSGTKAQVSLETTIEPHDLAYYIDLEPALHWRKAKVLPLRHYCLLSLPQDSHIDLLEDKWSVFTFLFNMFKWYRINSCF